MSARPSVWVLGYGNPGRLDDGLGPALAEAVTVAGLPGLTARAAYQLVPEDAHEAARHDVVVFADAALDGPAPFAFNPVSPEAVYRFTTHSVTPGTVLAMARDLFGAAPEGYLLAVRGYAFDGFGEILSTGARRNLDAALAFLLGATVLGGLGAGHRPTDSTNDRTPEVLDG